MGGERVYGQIVQKHLIAQELKSHWQTWSSDGTGGKGVTLNNLGRQDFQLFFCTYVCAAGELACFGHFTYLESAAFNYIAWSSLRQLLRYIN